MKKKILLLIFSIISVGWLAPMFGSAMFMFSWMDIQQRNLISSLPQLPISYSRAEISRAFFVVGIIWLVFVMIIWIYIGASRLFAANMEKKVDK